MLCAVYSSVPVFTASPSFRSVMYLSRLPTIAAQFSAARLVAPKLAVACSQLLLHKISLWFACFTILSGMTRLTGFFGRYRQGDITKLDVDAIVNAAKPDLLGMQSFPIG